MSPKNLNASSKTHKKLLNKLRDKRISEIYKKFEKNFNLNQSFIVAVSGGPDSLALSFLTKIYSIKKSLIAKYFIIDHKLRENSSLETQKVKRLLKQFNVSLTILNWHGKKPISNIQAVARDKRYNLLINQAKKLQISHILTGHHLDDIYENFLIRILRGSGLNGLVSFGENTYNRRVKIIRPLISFEKKDLIYLTNRIFKFYVKDPSNQSDKFKRSRVRKLINELYKEGFDKNKFLLTIKNLKYSDETIKFYTKKNLMINTNFIYEKKSIILNMDFFKQPHEIIFRSFAEVIKNVGKKYYFVRGKKLDKIIDNIKNSKKSRLKFTIGSCIVNKVNQTIIVQKEQ